MIFIKVIGAVYKLYQFDIVIQKNLKLAAGSLKTLKANPLVHRRKTVRAGKRTASAGFVIIDFMVGIRSAFHNLRVRKRKVIKIAN